MLHLNEGRSGQDLSIKMLDKNKLDGMLDLVTARATAIGKSKLLDFKRLAGAFTGFLSRHRMLKIYN
jgi:hypothetical protein